MRACDECGQTFKWDDEVVIIDDDTYLHKEHVELVPSEYVAYMNGEYIGNVDYEDAAFMILDTDEYEEDEEIE